MWGEHFANFGYKLCGYGPSFGHGPWFSGWIFPLFFWGIIIFALYSVARSIFLSSNNRQEDSAMETLRNRFASGEIDENEFTAQKAVLSKR